MKKITISDIAKLTGFSKSTVSAAINGKQGVSEKNRQKILTTIKQLNYEPNELARSLANNQSGSIGLIVSDITNPFFNTIVKAVENVADDYGYTVLLSNADFNHEKEAKAVRTLLRKRVDGIIITPLQHGVDLSHLFEIERQGVPLGVLGQVNGLKAYTVEQDDISGISMAMGYLISKGHRQIGHITGPKISNSSHVRLQAYKDELIKNNLPSKPSYIIDGGVSIEDGYRVGRLLLGMKERPSALICYNDLIAVGIAKAFNEVSLIIPRDLSLIGFDNIVDFLPFPLTSVEIPIYEMGKMVAEHLFNRLFKEESFHPQVEKVPTKLVVRSSVADFVSITV